MISKKIFRIMSHILILSLLGVLVSPPQPLADARGKTTSCDSVQKRVHGHGPASLRAVWRDLGITSDLYEWQNPTNDFAERAVLDVRSESGALPGVRGQYVLLIVSSDAPSFLHQYLFFVRGTTSCRYVGHVDAWDKYRSPKHRILPRATSGVWFVLSVYGGSGTGFYREIDKWYAVSARAVRRAVAYPSRGHDAPPAVMTDIGDAFDTTSHYAVTDGNEEVSIDLSVSYYGVLSADESSTPEVELFKIHRTIRLAWDAAAQQLVPDAHSQPAMRYLEAFGGESIPNIVDAHTEELKEIARRGTPEQTRWLRKYIEGVYGPEAEAIKAVLGSQQ